MKFILEVLLLSLTIILLQSSIIFARQYENSNHIKTATFYSEQFVLEPGKVTITDLFDIEFPRGHIGIKNFQAELVDEHQNSLPLYEAYLHHYFVLRYFENVTMSRQANQSQPVYGKYFRRNDGVCQGSVNSYSWGLGVDARKTSLELPDPFRIEVGTHPENVPKEYNEEKWLFNIMVIDTRGTEDKKGCTECRCDHYNVKSEDFLSKTGIDGKPMSITWVDWDQYQVPIKFYILDVTDQVTYNGSEPIHNCMVEYSITPQNTDIEHYHIKRTKIPMKKGGNLIYSTAHVHPGIVNATLYGENGKVLCVVQPTYGTGEEPGNEKGYVIGMSGKVTITDLFDIEFPRGHIGIKNFQAELVDEHRNSLPLYEAYLHHYFVLRYFENVTMSRQANQSQPIYGKYFRRNDGVCQGSVNSYSWGLGVDARKTSLELPDPFRIEVGTHPENVPKEYNEEKWLFNIMVIDTRGTEDKKGCTECRCDHYNVKSEDFVSKTGIDGKPMSSDYKGGIFCCEKTSQCKLQQGYNNRQQRKASLKYTVTWVDWDQYQVPIKFYILDVTDQVTYNGSEPIHNCMVEYSITPQNTDIGHYHIKRTKIPMKKGGNLIYSTAHVHPGIINATLYGEEKSQEMKKAMLLECLVVIQNQALSRFRMTKY
ncbi:uncharacterized protein [Arachis hypogaea]|uniref:uncharacterized protein n=1 Tax=Arachis hypogaea TaxID=3818 RepID=UPI003B21163A